VTFDYKETCDFVTTFYRLWNPQPPNLSIFSDD